MVSTAYKFKKLAVHRWVRGAKITESVLDDDGENMPSIRRFTATIDGFQGFRIYEGPANSDEMVSLVKRRTTYIKERIERGEDSVFYERNAAERSEVIERIRIGYKLAPPPKVSKKSHLIGIGPKNRGCFLVNNDEQCLDRKAFREIVEEAREAGLSTPYFIYGRIATYMGANIDFFQL